MFLLSELVRRDLAARYAGSFAGVFWTLLNPALTCALYGFVFSAVVRIPPPEGFAGSYLEFLLAGLIPWIGIQEALTRSATSVTDHANLVRKQVFPVHYLPIASLAGAVFLQAAAVAVVALGLAFFGEGSVRLVPLAGAFLLEFLVVLGRADTADELRQRHQPDAARSGAQRPVPLQRHGVLLHTQPADLPP